MMVLLIAVGVGAWAACGWLSYRLDVAYMARKWPTAHFSIPSYGMKYDGGQTLRKDKRLSALLALLGPISLTIDLLRGWVGGFYGLSIPTEEELRELAKQVWAARSAGA